MKFKATDVIMDRPNTTAGTYDLKLTVPDDSRPFPWIFILQASLVSAPGMYIGLLPLSMNFFHPGLCVSLSRAHLSRLRLTQQSLKRVGHEGKLCLKVEQRHCLSCLSKVALVRSHCLSRLGSNRCHRVHHRPITSSRYVGYILVDNSHLHTTPQAPLNHSGVWLCDLILVKC